MASLEKEIQQSSFANEHIKANLNVFFTANWLYNKISAILKPYNLTQEQFNVLRILRGSHPKSMCQKDILSRMVSPSSNVTLLVRKLVKKELISVHQSDSDRREYVINIKKKGLDLLKELDKHLENQKEYISKLTDAEAKQLNKLLDKMRDS
jgi:DNA-binding MarR family transcriptional regulator